jgi:hypothetical protein
MSNVYIHYGFSGFIATGDIVLRRSPLVAGSVMQGSAGVVSTVNDLLIYYDAGLTAWKHETRTNTRLHMAHC